jgi:hypothetical protein
LVFPWIGVLVLAVVAPFEALRPIVTLPGQSVSSVELVLLALFTCWGVALLQSRRVPNCQTLLTLPWLVFLAASLLAALLAQRDRSNALHAVGRLGLAFGVYLATATGASTVGRLRGVMVAFLLGGALTALLVILDYARVPFVLRFLEIFRLGDTVIGGQIRASGPFQYPTIASMYLELVFALGLGLLLVAVDARRLVGAVLVGVVLVLVAAAVNFTFTRAGVLTVAASLAIVSALRYRSVGWDRGLTGVAWVAAAVAVLFATSRSVEAWQLRLTTEGQETWYRANVDAPREVTLPGGSVVRFPVRVTNLGRATWTSTKDPRFYFSHHWLVADEDRVVAWNAPRSAFVGAVPPGVSAVIDVEIRAPRRPGNYRVLWDIEQEHRLWFSTEPGAAWPVTFATVTEPVGRVFDADDSSPTPSSLSKSGRRPQRLQLWRAAVRMFAAYPVSGVGPDNFRLRYGEYGSLLAVDSRVHSNNMYLEILAGGGLVSLAAFAWLFWRSVKAFGAAARARSRRVAALGSALAAAGVAIGLHGLVDSFLTFTATYITSAIVLGLAVVCGGLGRDHANSV